MYLTPHQEEIIRTGVKTASDIHSSILKHVERKPFEKDQRGLVAYSLFMRIDELYKSTILLANHAQPVGNYILIRTLSETYAIFVGVCLQENFHIEFLNKAVDKKIEAIESLKKDLDKAGINISSEELDQIKVEAKSSSTEEHQSLKHAKKVFGQLGLLPLYHQTFGSCSNFTHSDAHTLDRYVTYTATTIECHGNKDHFKDSVMTLIMSMSLYINSFSDLVKYLKIENPDLEKELAEVFNKYHDWASIELEKVRAQKDLNKVEEN